MKKEPRGVWGITYDTQGNGRTCAYEIYILHEMWRGMEPHRMLHILNTMVRSNYSPVQKNNIERVRDKVIQKINGQVQVAA